MTFPTVTRTYRATYTGRGEFYTGLRPGVRVEVIVETVDYPSGQKHHYRAARVDDDNVARGPWLALYERDGLVPLADVERVDPPALADEAGHAAPALLAVVALVVLAYLAGYALTYNAVMVP